MKCQACGIEKDPEVLEVYPFPEEDSITDDPIPPLMELECQDYEFNKAFKEAIVCHQCFHRLDPDMWISRKCWEKLNPIVPFKDLPNYEN